MHTTHRGFFSFIFMVLIACSVIWWQGWDKMALEYITSVVDTGTAAKESIQKKVDDVTNTLKQRDAAIDKEL